jgi:tRNA-specific 2-thiouridylase
MRVLAALSGGVDSSVAAALLRRAGHEVTGVHLKLGREPAVGPGHGCCTLEAADDARRVAQVLDIPFYVWDVSEEFAQAVRADFVREYARGRTPNPCVRCNERIKFGLLLARARRAGFDAVATGHYAIRRYERGAWRLYRSVDRAKDQSYVLATLPQEALAAALFPVGGLEKRATRALARALGLRVADKPDSYEICFVPDGDAAGFVERALGDAAPPPGEIVDAGGRVLGRHRGVHRFTVGQRRGLGLALAERRYVVEIDAARARGVVGPGALLARGGAELEDVSWVAGAPPVGAPVAVQLRAHGEPVAARLEEERDGRAVLRFDRPARGVAPGQLAAVYRGDELLGGGTIARALA